MTTISKTAQVLNFFAMQYGPPGIPRKRLVKLAYMADVIARQCLGHPITDLVYIKDHFGPNARELGDFAEELAQAEIAEQVTERQGEIRYIRLRAGGRPVLFDFTLGETKVLWYVVANYLSMEIDEFIDLVVKETDPVRAVERLGDTLPMERLDNTVRNTVGFDLEKIAKAELQMERGEFVTLAQLANELRNQASA